MTRIRRLLSLFLALALCAGLMVPAMAEDIVGAQYEKTAGYVAKTVASPGFGSIGGDWAVLGLARGGADVKSGYFAGYYERLESYVKACGGVLHKRKYTEYSRVALAVTAIGKDARNVAGYNLLLPLGDYEKTVYQGVNGAIFALLALDAGQYEVPVNADAKTQATRELYVQKILGSQLSDGGWNIAGTAADADLTAMALQALAGYTSQAAVKTAVDQGIAALSKLQGADGGFSTGGAETCESNAQVLVALAELGISLDDSRFVKNGNTALDALLTYANADGSFRHTLDGEANEMATEQALYALAAVKLAESGKSLYKMDAPKAYAQSGTFRDVVGHKNQKAIEALAEKGVINGMTADTFAPDAGLTRAQFCAIVVRALGLSQEKTAEFTDVLQTDWFCGFVGAASKAGIVNGVGNGKFNPQGAITREQAATMLARASKTLGLSGEAKDADSALKAYPDAQAASSYAKDALAFCAEHAILEADRTDLKPSEAICRCEVAQMVWNLLAAAGEV